MKPSELEYRNFVLSRAKRMSNKTEDILHMAIGISGEVAELVNAIEHTDPENILEELGDAMFYAVGLMALLETDFEQLALFGQEAIATDKGCNIPSLLLLIIAAGDLLDLAKKIWVYNKAVSFSDLLDALARVVYHLRGAVSVYKHGQVSNLDDVAALNMEKLKKRYPTGYSDAAAQARADKA